MHPHRPAGGLKIDVGFGVRGHGGVSSFGSARIQKIRTLSAIFRVASPFMKSIRTILGDVLIAVYSVEAQDQPPIHSKLWGKNDDTWSPVSRLPDFSFAGYRRGEHP